MIELNDIELLQQNKQVESMDKVKLTSALREETVEKSAQKSKVKTRDKIIVMIKECPGITQPKLAESLQISVKAVEKQIRSLRERGLIRRVGPAKGGHWEIIEQEDKEQ